jgi:hypothetical protein
MTFTIATKNRLASNIKHLGDLLKISNDLTPGELQAISMQLEGYALILRGYAMNELDAE